MAAAEEALAEAFAQALDIWATNVRQANHAAWLMVAVTRPAKGVFGGADL